MTQKEAAQQDGIVVYTSPFCGYCAAAKALLRSRGADFEEIDILADPRRRGEMIDRTGRRTVPQIFIAARHVGGFDDLQALDDAGELDALLSEVAHN